MSAVTPSAREEDPMLLQRWGDIESDSDEDELPLLLLPPLPESESDSEEERSSSSAFGGSDRRSRPGMGYPEGVLCFGLFIAIQEEAQEDEEEEQAEDEEFCPSKGAVCASKQGETARGNHGAWWKNSAQVYVHDTSTNAPEPKCKGYPADSASSGGARAQSAEVARSPISPDIWGDLLTDADSEAGDDFSAVETGSWATAVESLEEITTIPCEVSLRPTLVSMAGSSAPAPLDESTVVQQCHSLLSCQVPPQSAPFPGHVGEQGQREARPFSRLRSAKGQQRQRERQRRRRQEHRQQGQMSLEDTWAPGLWASNGGLMQ